MPKTFAKIQPNPDYEAEYQRHRDQGLRAYADGDFNEAIRALGRAALLCARFPEAHFDLGRALLRAGKIEAARQAYLRAFELSPNNSEVTRGLLDLPPMPPTQEDFRVGQRLKPEGSSSTYRIVEVRRGGFGAVYIVVKEKSEALLALKTFQARFLWSDEDRKRFEREALTWLMLDRYPHIVNARGLVRVEGFPCLVLDYVPHNLAQMIQRTPLSSDMALTFALNFCDGMFYANKKLGIVHRDIKPSNCLMSEDVVLKITDFGLARTFSEIQERSLGMSNFEPGINSLLTNVAGTPQYMSPEQFRAGSVLDTRSDIYSFGIMFYEMLTRDLPPVGYMARSHIENYSGPYNIPANLEQIILRCVQLDPCERPSDFGDLRNELAAAYEQLMGGPVWWQPNPKASEMSANDWNDKGIGLGNLGYLAEASTCFERALEIEVSDASLWSHYGGCLCKLGRFDEALHCFEEGLKINADSPDLWSNKAFALELLNRLQEARTCYERAVQLSPENETVWMNLGSCLAEAGHIELALSCTNRSLEINPRNATAWANKSRGLYSLGRYEESLQSCTEGLAIQPRDHILWYLSGRILMKLERLEEALAACNRALEIEQSDVFCWQIKGEILHQLGRIVESEQCLDRARALKDCN